MTNQEKIDGITHLKGTKVNGEYIRNIFEAPVERELFKVFLKIYLQFGNYDSAIAPFKMSSAALQVTIIAGHLPLIAHYSYDGFMARFRCDI